MNMKIWIRISSHPAQITTPAWICSQSWTPQVSTALVWVKLGMTVLETLLLSLVSGLPGMRWFSRRHSTWAACPIGRGQSSLMVQVAETGDPRRTTELDTWISAHGSVSWGTIMNWTGTVKVFCDTKDLYFERNLQGEIAITSTLFGFISSPFTSPFTNATSMAIIDTHVEIIMKPVGQPNGVTLFLNYKNLPNCSFPRNKLHCERGIRAVTSVASSSACCFSV